MGKTEKRTFAALCLIAIISFFFSSSSLMDAFTKSIPANAGTYREGVLGQPRFINPIYATSDTDKSLVNLVYAGLYRFNESGQVVPDLAESFPEVSEDQKTYTVKLKSAQWHNGLPVTANDVVFTIQTLQNPQFNSPKRNEWLSTEALATDERTVVFKLKDVSGPFLNNLTLPIISSVIWSKISPNDFVLSQGNIEAIGNGPYRIKEVKKLAQGTIQSVTLEAFESFPTARAHLETVRINFYDNNETLLKALHGNQIDGIGFNNFDERISIKQSLKDLNIHQIPLPQYQAVFINTSNKILGDVKIRQALNIAVNKPEILEAVYDNQGAIIDSPILAEQVSNLPETENKFNIEQAKTILEEAGWVMNNDTKIRRKGGAELKFNLATNDTNINLKTAQILIDHWQQIGVQVTLNSQPTRELNENLIKSRNYDLLLFAQKLGSDPDPFVFWHSSQTKHPGLNLSNYNNQTIDKLISEARASTDKTTRDQKYLELHNLMKQDLPAIFLIQSIYTYAVNKDILGIDIKTMPDETSRFYNLRNWYTDTRRVLK
jgi:peptide/nickel transport system substrate-binding protein